MKNTKEFPFSKARRIKENETRAAKKAIEKATGEKRPSRGRPPKDEIEKYKAISIRLHPNIIKWAKKEAKKKGMGYQQFLNFFLIKKVGL